MSTLKKFVSACVFTGAGLLPLSTLHAQNTADELFALASAHYNSGRYASAATYFEKLSEEYQADARAAVSQFYFAESEVQLQKYDEAIATYKQFIAQNPQHKFKKRASFRIGECNFLAEQFDEAYEVFTQFHKRYPEDALNEYVLPYLGQLEVDRENEKVAIGHFEQALTTYPEGVLADECRFGLGRALSSTDPDQAARFFTHVTRNGKVSLQDDAAYELGLLQFLNGKFEDAITTFNEFSSRLSASEYKMKAKYWLGRSLARAERYQTAKAVFDTLLGAKLTPQMSASVYFEDAIVNRQLENAEESDRLLEELYTRFPASQWADEAVLLLTQNRYKAGNFDAAIQYADKFLKDFSDSEFTVTVRELKGKSLLSLEKNEDAVAVFHDLLTNASTQTLTDNHGEWNYLLGLSHFRAEQNQQALSAFYKSEQQTENATIRAAINLAKAKIFLDSKQFENAIPELGSFLKSELLVENTDLVLAELARSHAMVDQYESANVVFERLTNETKPTAEGKSLMMRTATVLAEQAFRSKQYDLAIDWFGHMTKSDSKSDQAQGLSGLAWSYVEQGKADVAEKTFKQLIDAHPDCDWVDEAMLKRGLMLSEMDRKVEAAAAFTELCVKQSSSPLLPDALLNLTSLAQQSGESTAMKFAATQITKMLEARPNLQNDDKFKYQLAWLQKDLGDAETSEKIFKEIASNYKSSTLWADASYRLAEIAIKENRLEDAEKVLQTLDGAETAQTEIVTNSLYLRGKIAVDQKKWTNAATLMDQFINKYPKNRLRRTAEYWRAESNFQIGELDKAAEQFDAYLLTLSPTDDHYLPATLMRRAELRIKTDRWAEANTVCSRFIERFPEHELRYEVEYLLGRCLSRDGKFDEARQSFEKVLATANAKRTETAAKAQWMIGESYFHQEKYTEAIDAYYKTQILHPYPQWQSAALLQAGKCYEVKGEWNQAIKSYQELLEAYPSTAYATEATERLSHAKAQSDAGTTVPNTQND